MIKNAIIENVRFDTEHGLSIWVTVNYGGSGQGFGGCQLGGYDWRNEKNFAALWITELQRITGKENFDEMKGVAIRVKTNRESRFGGIIEGIGHIIEDHWFIPDEHTA